MDIAIATYSLATMDDCVMHGSDIRNYRGLETPVVTVIVVSYVYIQLESLKGGGHAKFQHVFFGINR